MIIKSHFESKDDYRTGCRNVSHCQQQQSSLGLRAPYEMIPGFKSVTLLLLFDRLINAE